MAQTWPLVGRREELELIAQVLGGDDGRSVILAGAAGVGKTRLAREALGLAAARGFRAEWVVASHSARSIPFGALVHLLPPDLPETAGRLELFRRTAEALRDDPRRGRLVLGIDDAHLLDPPAAALVHHLVSNEGVAVIAAIRSGEPAPDALVSLWKDSLAERIEIQALSRDEVRVLLEEALGGQVDGATLHRLWEATRGNPLFLHELVIGALDGGNLARSGGLWRWDGLFVAPPRIGELVRARLETLPQEDRAALELLAAGEPLELSIWSRSSGGRASTPWSARACSRWRRWLTRRRCG